MKRSAALRPLSHDHQHALDAALRLRRAEPDTLCAAVDHFLEFFEREGRRHFAIEEELLLPALRAGLLDAGSPYSHVLDAVAAALPPLRRDQRAHAERLAAGAPHERVGLEPYVPEEVMPIP